MRLPLALISLAAVALTPGIALAANSAPSVGADFREKRPDRPRLNGFLHGMDKGTPPAERITPLRPGLWRAIPSSAPYGRAVDFGARYEVVLSDTWGYPNADWYGRFPPWQNLAAWEAHVRAAARQARNTGVIFDIWNEPDDVSFWNGTREQFFETYLVAYRALRDELGPDLMVGGPSLARYDAGYIEEFLAFCRARGCEVNVLSWHEIYDPIPATADHVAEARTRFVNKAVNAPLRMSEIHVNETGRQSDQYHPGELLGYLRYLEKGGADAAARACWDDAAGRTDCQRHTLDGLLVPRTFEPRAAWWAAKEYADGLETRVASSSSDENVVTLASSRSPASTSAQLLVGRLDPRPKRSVPAKVDVAVELEGLQKLPFLRGDERVRVTIDRITASGESPLAAPVRVRTQDVSMHRNTAELTLKDLRVHEAFVVTLSAWP